MPLRCGRTASRSAARAAVGAAAGVRSSVQARRRLSHRNRHRHAGPQPQKMRWPPVVPSIGDLFGARFPALFWPAHAEEPPASDTSATTSATTTTTTTNNNNSTNNNSNTPNESDQGLGDTRQPHAPPPPPASPPPTTTTTPPTTSPPQTPEPPPQSHHPLVIPRKPRTGRPGAAASHNRVLPSYEDELQADNSVVRESAPRWFARTALHALNSLYHSVMGSKDDSRSNHQQQGLLSTTFDRLTRTPSDIQRVAVVGVHGWFPSRLILRVVGEPTGTSTHFARKMALACQHFFHERYGINLRLENMTIIPLEGEGKVEDRVNLLFNQITSPARDWADAIRNADLVLVAAHSQGTPVTAMLVARLIDEGILDPSRQRTGILAMAGISHGPYPHLKSSVIVKYVESDPARQLFDFNDPNSTISLAYYDAIHKILNAGTRFIAVGSWYDQVVPLYSATLHGINHPLIYRALYIDAADYLPDFLSHLVVFALKLRNAGLSDHGLIVHLSDVLAGNLYGFGTQGHYAIYEEENTYTVAVAWTMGSRPPWNMRATSQSFGQSHTQLVDQHPKQDSSARPDHPDPSHHPQSQQTKSLQQTPVSSPTRPSTKSSEPPKSTTSPSWSFTMHNELETSNAPGHTYPFNHQKFDKSFRSILFDPPFHAPSRLNPYHLPWIMARLTNDPEISRDHQLNNDLNELIRLFDSWDVGNSRALRDIKYRLEPLKSRL